MNKEMKKQLYQESQKLINEQMKVMDQGSEIGIHDGIAGEVYHTVSARKHLMDESIKFVDDNLDMKIAEKKNFEKFRNIVRDSDWIISNFHGSDMSDVEKTIERKWSIFKQRLQRSQEEFKEIEREYKAKKIIN